MLQFGVSPTDDTRSVNYNCNMIIIQATGKPDPVLVGWSCFSNRQVDRLVLAPKWHCLWNVVDPSCVNSITGSACRAKCSNILHDILNVAAPSRVTQLYLIIKGSRFHSSNEKKPRLMSSSRERFCPCDFALSVRLGL